MIILSETPTHIIVQDRKEVALTYRRDNNGFWESFRDFKQQWFKTQKATAAELELSLAKKRAGESDNV